MLWSSVLVVIQFLGQTAEQPILQISTGIGDDNASQILEQPSWFPPTHGIGDLTFFKLRPPFSIKVSKRKNRFQISTHGFRSVRLRFRLLHTLLSFKITGGISIGYDVFSGIINNFDSISSIWDTIQIDVQVYFKRRFLITRIH